MTLPLLSRPRWTVVVFSFLLGVSADAQVVQENLQRAACFNGFRYTLDASRTSWESAAARCRAFANGELARVTSEAEQDFITSNFPNLTLWIGLRKQNNTLQWASGETTVPYDNFQGDIQQTPDNQCFIISGRTGIWLPRTCNNVWNFLCKEATTRPGEWFSCQGSEWRMYEETELWMNAEKSCQIEGGHLANVQDFQSVGRCANTALETCFRNGQQMSLFAFTGLSNLINLSTFRWSSDNVRTNFSLERSNVSRCLAARVAPDSRGFSLFTSVCSSRRLPYICQRNLTTATTLYNVDCQGRTYRYHTIAFSWQEAEQNCAAAGGSLLQTTNETQLFCADRLFQQPELMIDSTVTEIGSWVDSSGHASIISELCPQWIASSNSVVSVNCSRPGPYICSTAFPSEVPHPPPSASEFNNTGTVVGVIFAVVVMAILAIVLVIIMKGRQDKRRTLYRNVHVNNIIVRNSTNDRLNDNNLDETEQKRVQMQTSLLHGMDNPVYSDDHAPATMNNSIPKVCEAETSFSASKMEGMEPDYCSAVATQVGGVSNAVYLAKDDTLPVRTFQPGEDDGHYSNAELYSNKTPKNDDAQTEPMYEAADPKYYTLEREASQRRQEAEASYEAIVQHEKAATTLSKDSLKSEGSFGSMTSSYDDVLAVFRNSLQFKSPPTSEEDIYSTLKNKIYVHLHRKNIKTEIQIGIGHFGYVMRGIWRRGDNTIVPVAVKSLRTDVERDDRIAFLKEAIIMGQFFHRNVVTMFGVVVDCDPYMLVLELMKTALRPYLYGMQENDPSSAPVLIRFAIDIATGMEYLSAREFVHRDLAARNILLDDKLTCKIADFGMSRNLDDGDYYTSKNAGPIPVKWTAQEALHYHRYSTSSDVWSFGIVVQEIFSFGRKPYTGMKNEEVIAKVCDGYRLPRTEHCPPEVHDMQMQCWDEDPHRRPSFSDVRRLLEKYESDHTRKSSTAE